MNTRDLFSMCSEDDSLDLGVLYSASDATLRLFGAAYMRDPDAKGTLKILDPKGEIVATYDYWQEKWIDTADAAS